MAVLKTENSKSEVAVILIVGTTTGMSQVANSTFPCANIVTAQSWSALPAS